MTFMQFEQTFNPDAVRVYPELEAYDEGHVFTEHRQAAKELIYALLAIDGVAAVSVADNYVTVTRIGEHDSWVSLWPQIAQTMTSIVN